MTDDGQTVAIPLKKFRLPQISMKVAYFKQYVAENEVNPHTIPQIKMHFFF